MSITINYPLPNYIFIILIANTLFAIFNVIATITLVYNTRLAAAANNGKDSEIDGSIFAVLE